jgi:hypothetical protein
MAHHRQRHSLQDVDECALCAQESKTADHLFVGCVYSRELWSRIFRATQLQVAMPASTDSLVGWWLACRQELSNEANKGFDSFLLLVTWSLWGERNRRVLHSHLLRFFGSSLRKESAGSRQVIGRLQQF